MRYSVNSSGFKTLHFCEDDRIQSILQNVVVLLETKRGTCPFYRDFGLSQEFMDKPIPAAMALMRTEIKEAVEAYEPRAEVVSVTFAVNASKPGQLIPTVEVEILDE